MVWAFILELYSECLDFSLKSSKSFFDVGGLFGLEGENLFFHSTESVLRNFNKDGLRVLKMHQQISVHLELMFLEKKYCLLHGFDLAKSPIFDLLDVTEMGHNLHE